MFKRAVTILSVCVMSVLCTVGCGDDNPSFSLLPEEDVFTGFSGGQVSAKMDILWVIDNSGSMQSSQENVRDNFDSFIQDFSSKGYDYQIAVTTTEAYKSDFGASSWSRFRDGTNAGGHSGIFVITPSVTDVIGTFITNVMQGTSGSGDERGLQSFRAALNNTDNSGFVREDGYLAVIVVSDEEDRSSDYSGYGGARHDINDYVTYLDNLTNSSGASRRYSVNSVVVLDDVCKDFLNNSFTGRSIGQRYIDLSNLTGGTVGSLCGDFSDILGDIADSIIRDAVQVYLSRIPKPETIKVSINEVDIPESSVNGWTYDADANSIQFNGTHVPAQGDTVTIDYDPVNYGS